jgi:mersacidin/lichenicidin family type 2 lantibiotic
MSVENIIRAWEDEAFRHTLSAAERARLPEHPAGLLDLTAAELDTLTGGVAVTLPYIPPCSTPFTK